MAPAQLKGNVKETAPTTSRTRPHQSKPASCCRRSPSSGFNVRQKMDNGRQRATRAGRKLAQQGAHDGAEDAPQRKRDRDKADIEGPFSQGGDVSHEDLVQDVDASAPGPLQRTGEDHDRKRLRGGKDDRTHREEEESNIERYLAADDLREARVHGQHNSDDQQKRGIRPERLQAAPRAADSQV
ncbi:hypothetical protein CRV24_010570 [Beauveria bassiana]|nr:hypothetical protein CRV24_010570 [Beauveria bassiana]